ncbi:MAG: TonB-dependent receptor plug domain-containing protein [Sphingomonadales bacterium]
MNLTKSRYVGLLLASTSALSFNITTAQEAGNDQEIEEVVVTGSHIRRSGFSGRAPISVVDSAAIAEIGAAQPVDVLKSLTSNSGSQMYGETNSMRGAAQFNIRGLGLGSSLTLLNGRRAGIAPMSDASGSEFLDINQFPLLMIERIEVLTDGASATYGSQAVAGVANIITRKGFEGFELSADYRTSSNRAGSLNMAVGHSFDKGHFNMYASHYQQGRNNRTAYDWLRKRIHGDGDLKQSRLISSTGSPGTYYLATPDANGVAKRTGTAFPDPDCEAALGILRTPTDSRCRYDFADQVSVISAEDRTQVFMEMDWEFNEDVRWYTESHFSRNVVRRSGGGSTFNTGTSAGGSTIIPGSHPFNFFIQGSDADGNATETLEYVGPQNWNKDTMTAVDIICVCRPIGTEANGLVNRETYMDEFNTDLDVYSNRMYIRVMNGLEVSLPNDWMGDLSYSYSSAAMETQSNFNYRSDILVDMIANGDWNPFGTAKSNPNLVSPKDGVSVAKRTADQLKLFNGVSVSRSMASEHVIDAIANGDVAEMADGGIIGGAVGFQYRRVELNNMPNPLSSAGEANESSKSYLVQGKYEVWALFAESVIPFADWGELQLAVRREDYGGNIGATTDPKISFEVRPDDVWGFRGSWGTSFQAPTVRQTATASTSGFVDDPGSPGVGPNNAVCIDEGYTNNVVINVMGSAGLKPQSAKNYNLGVTANEGGFRFSADYWNFNYTNLIAQSEGAQAIINNDCLDDGIINDPRVIRDGSGQLRQVNTEFVNIGNVKTDGIDVAMQYTHPVGESGELVWNAKATYVNKFNVTKAIGSTPFDGVGSRNFTNNFSTLPRFKANASVTWRNANQSANLTARHISGYKNDQGRDGQVKSFKTLDFQYSVVLDGIGSGDTSVSFGVNNIFDIDPPGLRKNDANGNLIQQEGNQTSWQDRPGYDPKGGVDIRGRIMYMSLKQAF